MKGTRIWHNAAPKSLTLSLCDRQELEKLLNKRSTAQQVALRAKIILLADKGSNNREIGRALNISRYMARVKGGIVG